MVVVGELRARYVVHRTDSELVAFRDAILQRDLFWNVRDWSEWFDGRVRAGVLFRGSSLTRWQNDPALRDWFKNKGVSTVIDFRPAGEGDAYSPSTLAGLTYVSAPLSPPPDPAHVPSLPTPRERGEAYFALARSRRSEVVTALRAIARADGSAVVHCHAGKDRTGWFCALLGMLLGLPPDAIADDYLASGMDVAEGVTERFMECVAGEGGAEGFLRAGGLTHEDGPAIRKRLLSDLNGEGVEAVSRVGRNPTDFVTQG